LESSNADLLAENEYKAQVSKVIKFTQGATSLQEMCDAIISELARMTKSGHGVFYVADNESEHTDKLSLAGSYASVKRKNKLRTIKIGEGLEAVKPSV